MVPKSRFVRWLFGCRLKAIPWRRRRPSIQKVAEIHARQELEPPSHIGFVARVKTWAASTFGVNPRGVAFDGADIWVSNYSSNTVNKL
jgi:hypothetical protein